MLIEILSSDNFLYPLYLAIKAAYLPAILLGDGHLMAELIAVIIFCVFIALLGGAAIKWWLKLLLIAAGWALVSYPYMEFALLSLPIWPFLFWRRRYWGLALVGLALECLIGIGAGQLIDLRGRTAMFYYLGFIAFAIVRVRLPMLQRFRATVLSLLFAFLALYSVPKIYEDCGVWLLAKLPSMQPQIVWMKEPEKWKPYGFSTVNNLYLNDKLHKIAVVIYDKNSVDKKMLEQMHEQGKLPVQMDLYGYFLPKFGLNYDNLHFNDLLAKNKFTFNDLKEYIHSKLQYEINLKTTKLLDEIIIHKGD